MTCSDDTLKAFVLGEMNRQERVGCEDHIAQCPRCREELDRLQLTHSGLLSVSEEEIPRRIAFVSDRVFEPKWWQFWTSAPASALASAVLISGAILAHGYARQTPVTAPTPVVNTAQIEQRVEQEVTLRMRATLAQTVADLEKREDAKHQTLLASAGKKLQAQGQELAAAQQANRLYQQQMGRMMVAYNTRGGQ